MDNNEKLTFEETKQNLIRIANELNEFIKRDFELRIRNDYSIIDYQLELYLTSTNNSNFSIHYINGNLYYKFRDQSKLINFNYLLSEFQNGGQNDPRIRTFLFNEGKNINKNRLIITEEIEYWVCEDSKKKEKSKTISKNEHCITANSIDFEIKLFDPSIIRKLQNKYIINSFLNELFNTSNTSHYFEETKENYLRIIDEFKKSAEEYMEESEKMAREDIGENEDMPEKVQYNVYFDLLFNGEYIKDEIKLMGYPAHWE